MKYGLIFKLIIIIFISLFKKEVCSFDLIYPTSLTLFIDNLFFIVEQRGIYIVNSAFEKIERSYNFSDNDKISNLSDLSNTLIKYIKLNSNWYILCLIKSKIYLFSPNGICLNQPNQIIDEYRQVLINAG